MPQTMKFHKFGRTVELDVPTYAEAHENSKNYGYFYGVRQSLQDSYANTTDESAFVGKLMKKYDNFIAGELTFRFDGSGPRKTALELEMESIAETQVLGMAAKAGKALTKAQLASRVEFWMGRNVDELTEMAEAALAARAAKAAEYAESADDAEAAALFAGM